MLRVSILLAAAVAAGCAARGPVLDTGSKPAAVGGTIAGIVKAAGSEMPLSGRRVTAVEVTSGARYGASTAINGGYTIKVPQGTYRLELELRAGESLAAQPAVTEINASDLDAGRDFVVTVRSDGRAALSAPVPAPRSGSRAAGGWRRTSSSRAIR